MELGVLVWQSVSRRDGDLTREMPWREREYTGKWAWCLFFLEHDEMRGDVVNCWGEEFSRFG